MQTNYEFTKARSSYHYDTSRMDPRWDCVHGLGKFEGEWQDYVPLAIKNSKIVNWANKTYTPDSGESTRKDLEINDLLSQGLDPNRQIMYRVVHDLAPFRPLRRHGVWLGRGGACFLRKKFWVQTRVRKF
jgi:hypothetical protein